MYLPYIFIYAYIIYVSYMHTYIIYSYLLILIIHQIQRCYSYKFYRFTNNVLHFNISLNTHYKILAFPQLT